MTINTKYAVGQKLYFNHRGQFYKLPVYNVTARIDEKTNSKISYTFYHNGYIEKFENEVFKTKKPVMNKCLLEIKNLKLISQ